LIGTTGDPTVEAALDTSKNAKSLRSIMATGVPPASPSSFNPVAARAAHANSSG
jgi:hypothetical protein